MIWGLNIAWSAVIAVALAIAIPVTWYVAVRQMIRYFRDSTPNSVESGRM